jgi:hypothetical protein
VEICADRELNIHSRDELFEIIDRVTPEMVERAFGDYSGRVEEVAGKIDEYYEAGMTLACIADLLPAFRPIDTTPDPLAPTRALCRKLKIPNGKYATSLHHED